MRKFVILGLIVQLGALVMSAQDKESYIRQYLDIAIAEMHRTGIPASIKLSQAILESNFGRSELAREAHNHFGIKCGRDWAGKGYHLKDDDRDSRGELVHSCFRTFKSVEESYIAHSDFLTDPAKAHRYGDLFKLAPNDYKGWAEGLKRGGYATNPDYARLLCKIIEEQKLYEYDVARIDASYASRNKKQDRYTSEIAEANALANRSTYTIQYQNDIPYIIAQAGDNVKRIAQQTDVAPGRIIKYNEYVDNRRSQFASGDRIYLQPLKRTYHGGLRMHTVKDGETVASIAHFYGIKSDVLRKRNNMPDNCEPLAGTQIALKGKQRKNVPCASPSAILASANKQEKPREYPVPVESPAVVQRSAEPTTASTSSQKQPPPATASQKQPQTAASQPKTQSHVQTASSTLSTSDLFAQQVMSYTVQPKDTLYQIATKHGISVVELKKLNNLDSDTIRPGQALKVSNR